MAAAWLGLLDLALQQLLDDELAIDAEGIDERVDVERRRQRVSKTERQHSRDIASSILERPDVVRRAVGLGRATRKVVHLERSMAV